MIVPDYRAEARRIVRCSGTQVTVRRFGWSTSSEADAQAMAERRAEEALQQILSGEPIARREPKVAYNGADGVPVREEVLARHGEHVIMRNQYGSRCLNTPDALFGDVDLDSTLRIEPALVVAGVLAVLAFVPGWFVGGWTVAAFAAFLGLFFYVARCNRVAEDTCHAGWWKRAACAATCGGICCAPPGLEHPYLSHTSGTTSARNTPEVRNGRSGSDVVFLCRWRRQALRTDVFATAVLPGSPHG